VALIRVLLTAAVTASVGGAIVPTSANALLVRDARSTRASFAGSSCGDNDEASLVLPRTARSVRVTAPSVGDDLMSDDGFAVAEVRGVHIHGRRVVVTVQGAHDVCADPEDFTDGGWETSSYSIRARYKLNRRVIVFSCGNPRRRPRRIVIACGDGNYLLRHLHWSRWGDRVATGSGDTFANDCVPFCAAGHFRSTPARVRLFRPRYCSTVDRWNYTRGYIYASGKRRQRVSFGWACHSGLA
jgi:hypothetical protein